MHFFWATVPSVKTLGYFRKAPGAKRKVGKQLGEILQVVPLPKKESTFPPQEVHNSLAALATLRTDV